MPERDDPLEAPAGDRRDVGPVHESRDSQAVTLPREAAPPPATAGAMPAAKPKAPRRWLRRLRLAAEIATLLVALPSLGLLCSVPSTGKLTDENPTSTAFIDLRHDQAEAAGKAFKLQWQ